MTQRFKCLHTSLVIRVWFPRTHKALDVVEMPNADLCACSSSSPSPARMLPRAQKSHRLTEEKKQYCAQQGFLSLFSLSPVACGLSVPHTCSSKMGGGDRRLPEALGLSSFYLSLEDRKQQTQERETLPHCCSVVLTNNRGQEGRKAKRKEGKEAGRQGRREERGG